MSGRVLIVGAAPATEGAVFYTELIRAAAVVIAADAGARRCRAAGRLPDACVGDLDSIDAETLSWLTAAGVPVHRHPADKDASDLDLALDLARTMGASGVDLTAAFRGRIDHTLAAFGTLQRAADLGARALEADFVAYPLEAASAAVLELALPVGATISLFALERGVVVSASGVAYPLAHAELPPHVSLGLSNRAAAPTQRIELASGRALCIVPTTADG